jgi:hypothetical protein
MVFRDYVQGAYRMRGIGIGQKIHVYIIPEVQELMQRELKEATINTVYDDDGKDLGHVLEDVVAWLFMNSLRSEQTQWFFFFLIFVFFLILFFSCIFIIILCVLFYFFIYLFINFYLFYVFILNTIFI